MAVKCPKKIIPRLYFSGSPKERKSRYYLRNSSFNLSLNSPPKITSKCSSSSLNIINKHSTKKKKELISMQERKREYSLRNSSFNLCYSSPLKRTARSLESPNIKTEPPIRNKLKKLNCTQGRKKENILRNSCCTVSRNSRRKRNANCIEYTPKTEHPMRKKLRELACISTPKNTSVTDQNLAIDEDLNSCVLTRNKRKVLNSISIKSLDSENVLQSSKKYAPSRISTRSISKITAVSERCNKTSKTVMKAANSLVSKGVGSVRKEKDILGSRPVNISNSVQAQLKDVYLRVVPLCEDELVCKPKYMKSSKCGAKSSFETPVIKQNSSRILRSKDKASICNRITDNIIRKQKDSLKANYLDTLTPVTTRLKKRPCEVKHISKKVVIAAVPERGRKKNSVFKTSSGARQFPCVEDLEGNKDSSAKTSTQKEIGTGEGKEQVEFQRKTRNTRKVFEKNFESPIEKRITRSTIFGKKYEELSSFDSYPKKSKRHTFPNSNKSSKSKNHLRVYSVGHFNNVPLDVLTQPATSFHESLAHTSKTESASVKKITPKASLKAKKDALIKSPVPKISLKGKKTKVELPKIKSPVPKTSLKGKKAEVELPEKTSGPSKKVPAVGTLKRKRWIMKTLKEKSEGYEDDIFENRKNGFPKPLVGSMISDDESDATDFSIATPICGFLLTPNSSRRSPQYKPCISSNDLTAARRVAEEYLYRRNKTWKQACKTFPENKAVTSENNQGLEKNTEYSEALADVLKAQADIEKLTQEESEEEDDYFSDVS